MVNELEKKYNTKIRTAINNNNPYTQVLDLKPQKTEYKPTVNPYNQQTEQKLKPLPKADFEPLVNQAKYTYEGGIVNPLKSLYRTATNLDDASTYSQTKFPSTEGYTQENKPFYLQQTELDTQRYKSVKDSMESQYDYANMPETTKKAYEEVVNTLLTRETYGKSFDEQRQTVQLLYEGKEIPDFVQKKLANIDSKETEYNLNVENARQNLVKMAMDNASDVRNLELKYADKDISQATRFTTDILGSIVKMSPYIAVSAITGGVGGATLGTIAGSGTMYAQVYTDSMSKAINEGATREQATEYAHASAMIETGTEMLSGGIPGAPKGLLSSGIQGKIDDVVKVMVKDGTFRKFISTGVDVFGEGAEEALAEYLGSMALSIYTEDERSDEELTQDMIKAFIMGSVTSATMQMGKYGIIKGAEKFVAEKSTDVQNISLEQANDVMNRIALRTQVENFDGLSYKLEDLPKGNNGYIIDGKTIVLNRNQVEESGLIESALPHEMTHALEKVKGYDQLASFVVNLKAKTLGMDLAQLQQVYQEKFDEVHQQSIEMGDTSHQLEIATPDKMARELVAEFIKDNIASRPYKDAQGNIQYDSDGNIITYRNYDALLRLASNQPNMVNKIKKVIRSMIRKSQISEALEFDQTQKADFLIMQEYLESLDGYLNTVLDNADKGLFATEQAQGLQFDTKVLSPNTEQGVKVIRAYESENEQYKGTLEDAQKLLDYSARKGLGFNEVQYEGGTLVRPNNIQLSLDQLKKNDIDVNEVKNVTVEQQEFFKDSKVRDEQGNLIEMYHGTPDGSFTKFKSGSYFTSNKEYADKYQNTGASSISTNKVANNPKTYEVYLNITKPFDTRIPKIRKIFETEYYRKYGMGSPLTERGLPDWLDGMDLQEFIEEKGYDFDGLILDEGATGGYGEEVVSRGISYVVFNPNQVKEVTNLNPTSSPDIRYSLDNSLVSKLNLSTLIPLIEQSKQSASDYINSLNIQSDNPNVIKYIETMSNFVRDYNPDLRYDTIGNLTTQAQEDDFNLRENGKLKVFYLSGEPFNKDAINYGYILTSNPVGLDNPKQVYVSLRKPLYDIVEESMQEFNFVLGKDIQKVIDVFNSKGNNLVLDTDELTNAEILKAIGDELGSVDKMKEFYQTLNEVTGYDGIELTSSRQIILFNESQFGEAKVKGEYSEQAKKEVKTINFKKSGTEYLVRMTNFNGVEETRALSKEDVIEVLGDDFAKVVLNATNQEQSYDVVENIISKPSNKIKQGVFSQERDDHDNQLTEEVVKFNSESSIRQKDGTLKVMYHGSPNRFEEFSYLNLGATGAQEGIGIYFTDSPLQASQYTRNEQGMVYEVYLNIKNPTNKTKKTITKEQLKQIVLDIHNSEDNEFLYNYGDISREGLDTVANKAVNLILESNKNNVDIIDTVLIDSRIDTEQGLRIVNQYTGIDGYTLNTSDGMVSIAFFPEQIKSINNPNPTTDRRIQYSIELDSVKQQQIEQAKLNSTNNFSDARSILNDGTITTSDSVPLESVLLNPIYNQAIINKMPTKAQKEQLQAFYLDTLARSGDTVYLELHDNDRVAYLKYPVVSDLSRIDSDIAKFYQDDSQRKEFFKNANPEAFDEQGNLKMWYHGSDQTFTIPFANKSFGQYKFGDDTVMFFTNREDVAKTYQSYKEPETFNSETLKGSIYKGYINFKKPFIVEGNKKNWNDLNFIDIDAFFNKKQATQEEKDYLSYMVDNDILVGKKIDSEYTKSKINNAYDLFNKISNIDSEYKNKKALLSDKKIIEKFYNQVKNYDILYSKNKSVFDMMYDISNRLNNYAYYLSSKGFENQDVIELSQYIKDFGYLVNKDGNVASYQKASTSTNDIVKNVLQSNKLGLTDYDSVLFKGITDIGFNTKEIADTIEKMSQKEFKTYVIQKYSSDVLVTLKEGMFKDYTNLTPTLSPDIRYSIEDERIRTQKFSKSVLESNLSKQTQDTIEKKISEGTFNSVVVADRPSIERALAEIGDDVDKAYNKFKAKIDSGLRMTKDDLVIGQLLIKKLEKSRQTEKVVSLVQDVALLGTELGQQVQALYLIKRMSAEGKLMMMQKTLTRLQDSVNSSKDRNAPRVQLEIPKEYQEFFVEVGARTQELEEQRVQLGKTTEELKTIEREIDSLLLSNVGSEIDTLSRELSELRALEKEESRLVNLVEQLQNRASSLSSEDIDLLQEDARILREQINAKQGSLNEIKQKQAKLSRLESQLAKLQQGESLFLDYSIEENKKQIDEYQSRINEINKQKRKYTNLESTLERLSGVDPNVIAELNAKVKVVRKAERLLKKLVKENERFTSKENVDDVLDEVKDKIAEQLPVTLADKINAWRYLSMLGNPRTHVRNFLGNAFVMPMSFFRDVFSVGLQKFIPQEQRTRALFASKESIEFAKNDYQSFGKDIIEKTQKYDVRSDIERRKKIFNNKPSRFAFMNPFYDALEWAKDNNYKALEKEDEIYVSKHYIAQMSKYLTAQNIDLNTITDEQLENARQFAILEAKKMTFKQNSKLVESLKSLSRQGKIQKFIVDANIPFLTPINILKMGVEYSPIGLMNGIYKLGFDVRKGKVTAAQAIDMMSAGLTGTGIALVGMWAYSMGFIEIGGDDDETKRVYNYKNSLGRQNYSLKFGDGSYSIDWIAPAIMPFIMGAEMARALEKDGETSWVDAVYEGSLRILDPIFELSMLQGITSTLQSFSGTGPGMFVETATSMASNYFNQFIPTLLGQISRTIDPIQRSTIPNAEGFVGELESIVRRMGNKTPFSAMMNAPVVDVKGQPISSDENPFMRAFMNLFSPGYYKTDNTTEIDQEILRLYELTENTNVLPKATPTYFTRTEYIDGEKQTVTYRFGNKEYSQFGQTMGKESYELLGKLTRYDLDDDTKVKVMSKIYEYAYELAKDEYLKNKGIENEDSGNKEAIEAELKGIPTLDYLIAKTAFSTMSGEDKQETFQKFLDENGFDNDLMEIVGGYKPSSSRLKTKGLKKLK